MGDPKKIRKKYETPRHPWIGSRITEEKELVKSYGLRNKKEVWKMETLLKGFKDRAKKLVALTGAQVDKERAQLLQRLARLGITTEGATFDDILGLNVQNVLDRRLQTLLVKKHLARTPKQARQMINHRHVMVDNTIITSPAYLVTLSEEAGIAFANRSAFVNEQHPERFSEEELARKAAKEAAKKEKVGKSEEPEVVAYDEKAIEEAEVLAGEKLKKDVKAKKEESKEALVKDEAKATTASKEAPAKEAAPVKKAPAKAAKRKAVPSKKESEKARVVPKKEESKEALVKDEAKATTASKKAPVKEAPVKATKTEAKQEAPAKEEAVKKAPVKEAPAKATKAEAAPKEAPVKEAPVNEEAVKKETTSKEESQSPSTESKESKEE